MLISLDSNVDRLFAIWQALHPRQWFPPPGKDRKGRPLKPDNEKDLLPFYKYRSELGWIYYDSDWVRDTEKLGYTYPDIDGLRNPSTIWSGVYYRYIWSVRRASSSRFSSPPPDMMPLKLNRAQVFKYPDGSSRTTALEPLHSAARVIYKRVTSSGSDTFVTESRGIQSEAHKPEPDNEINPHFDREWFIDNVVKR